MPARKGKLRKWGFVSKDLNVSEARKKNIINQGIKYVKERKRLFSSFESAERYRKRRKIKGVKTIPVYIFEKKKVLRETKVQKHVREIEQELKKYPKNSSSKFSGKGVHRNRNPAQDEIKKWEKKGYEAKIKEKRLAGELVYQVYVKPKPNLPSMKKILSEAEKGPKHFLKWSEQYKTNSKSKSKLTLSKLINQEKKLTKQIIKKPVGKITVKELKKNTQIYSKLSEIEKQKEKYI